MKPFRFLAQALFLSAALLSAKAQSASSNTVIGQWDFDTAQLEKATVGTNLQFMGFTPSPVTLPIGGNNVGAMAFPALAPDDRILATFASTNNGGGTNLNQYTILMDVMYPAESEGTWRALFNTDTSNANQADMFVDPDGRIGVNNDYTGVVNIGEWSRLVFVVNTASNFVHRFQNGTQLQDLDLPNNSLNGRFSLSGGILFFSDALGDTAPGFVNVIQLRAGLMTTNEVAALGGPASNGIGQGGGEPTGPVRITNIQVQNNIVTVTVENLNGRTAQLQTSPTLVNPTWTNTGAPSSSGTLTAPYTGGIAFFRAQVN